MGDGRGDAVIKRWDDGHGVSYSVAVPVPHGTGLEHTRAVIKALGADMPTASFDSDAGHMYAYVPDRESAERVAASAASVDTAPDPWEGLVRIKDHGGRDDDLAFSVTGNLGKPGDWQDGNHRRTDAVIDHLRDNGGIPAGVTFDSESGGFYAYTASRETAERVARACAAVSSDWFDADRHRAKQQAMDAVFDGTVLPADHPMADRIDYFRSRADQAARNAVESELEQYEHAGYFDQ